MAENKDGQNGFSDALKGPGDLLRRRAEAWLRRQSPDQGTASEEVGQLLHELQVHQIELEMQNEELRRAQQELEVSRTRYFDLYDLAPVGYLTLSEHGLILEANLTAAQLLGVERSGLAGQPVSRFIVRDDQDIYYFYRKKLFETGERQVCEVRMSRQGGNQFWTRLETTAAQNGESGAPVCRTVMSDITERKQAEEALRKARDELELRVQERTAELRRTNEELRIHATLLEQSNRDLEDFAHVVSHDLQEPLRKIQTFSDRIGDIAPGVPGRRGPRLPESNAAGRRGNADPGS